MAANSWQANEWKGSICRNYGYGRHGLLRLFTVQSGDYCKDLKASRAAILNMVYRAVAVRSQSKESQQSKTVSSEVSPAADSSSASKPGNVSSLRDSTHEPHPTRHSRAGLQVVPSPFDKLRASSAGLLGCGVDCVL